MTSALNTASFSFAAVGLVALSLTYQPLSGSCASTLVASKASSNRQWKIVVFKRDCGATTRYSTHISVIRAGGSSPSESGNAFTAAGRSSSYGFARDADGTAGVRGRHSRVFKRETAVSGVSFRYE